MFYQKTENLFILLSTLFCRNVSQFDMLRFSDCKNFKMFNVIWNSVILFATKDEVKVIFFYQQ